MDPRLYMAVGAVLLVVLALAALMAYLRRRRRARDVEERLLIGPRLQAWVGPASSPAPPSKQAEHREPSSDETPPIEEVAGGSQPAQSPVELEAANPTEMLETAPSESVPAEMVGPSADQTELAPSAPVEFTIGDTRIEVQAGTEAHTRLRAYADALLDDLKATRRRSR